MLSLSLEGNTIRLLEVHGRKVVRWHSQLFNPALVRRGAIADTAAMAQVITKALEAASTSRGDVVGALDGSGCQSRVITMPLGGGGKPAEFIPREARRLWSVGLDDIFLFWQPLPGKERKFFVLSVPRGPFLAFRETLRLAGLRPYRLDIRPIALARAVNQSAAVVACLESNSIVVVILVDSVPLVMQTHWLGETPLIPSAVSSQFPGILSQALSFYTDTHRDVPLGTDMPLFLVGSAVEPALAGKVETEFGLTVRQAAPIFSAAADFPWQQFWVNLGLLMKL
ncbi:MAG: hypothetical protein Q7T05_03900 [Dehalococcoidia bacterium]|nr:hypothetical protein [Dehalococcoidia bacterium]